MARQASILLATPSNISAGATQTDFTQSVSATSAGTAITLSKNRLIQIVCQGTGTGITAGVNVAFYSSAQTSIPTPTASYFLIPYGQVYQIDLGQDCDTVNFFNPSAGAASVWVKVLSVN